MPERDAGLEGVQEEPLAPNENQTNTEPTEAPEAEEAPSAKESVWETVRRAYAEEKKKLSDGDEGAESPLLEAQKPQPQTRKSKKQAKLGTPEQEDIRPPERFSASHKEVFNKAPRELKEAINKMVHDHQAEFTRGQQQLSQAFMEVRSIHEAVQPYIAKWGERGFTAPAAIAALAAAQEKLTDPKTSLETYIKLGEDLGHDVSALREGLGEGQSPKMGDISQHPQFLALQSQLNEVKSLTNSWQEQQSEAAVSRITAEMAAVREEKDAYGRYKYPELHDDAFLDQVKPLVSALVGTSPGVGYGEALKRAYYSVKGYPGDSAQPIQTKLPNENRAITANVSVRGKSAPGTNGMTVPEAAKIPRSAADTVRMVYEQLKRGV